MRYYVLIARKLSVHQLGRAQFWRCLGAPLHKRLLHVGIRIKRAHRGHIHDHRSRRCGYYRLDHPHGDSVLADPGTSVLKPCALAGAPMMLPKHPDIVTIVRDVRRRHQREWLSFRGCRFLCRSTGRGVAMNRP